MGCIFFKSGKDTYESPNQNFWEIKATDIDNNQVSMEKFKGKKAFVVVNVASACGYTNSNYKQLVELYNKYKNQGLEILAFPCNQFMSQEKKCEVDIKAFIEGKYNVEFPMFSKIDVNGPNTHEVFKYIKSNSQLFDAKTKQTKNIPWNFTQFLLDSEGKVVNYYDPSFKLTKIEADIQKLLGEAKKQE